MLLQHLAHERQVRIHNRRPQRLGMLEAFHFNGAPHGVGMDVEGLCNRADLPMLGKEIAANLHTGFGTDHPGSPSSWNAWERIDEAAWPAADRAAQPGTSLLLPPAGQLPRPRDRNRHRDRFSTAKWCRRNDRMGRLIRHAGRVALPVGALPVAMIEPALRTLLVPAVGRAVLPEPGFAATSRAAIALPAVAVRAN